MTPFSAADLRARLPRLAGRAPGGVVEEIGDHILNPDWAQLAERPAAREAAVLVPVVDDPAGATLILTRRADSLRKHSGQVAFPGGSIDPEDASAEAAALRDFRPVSTSRVLGKRHWVHDSATVRTAKVPAARNAAVTE